ncbi:subtilisin-like protease 3 [Miscanthus floridulus]|uniref:subtilisin-like protease 3 n=1 Tax=Miscanthus floridulus TaxID=154761 RepID=UPI00345AB58B
MDIIAGLDAAVKGCVDMLSFSIGAYSGMQFNYDPIAIAVFKAMERGIFVSCAAGNAGPDPGTVSNGVSWMLTIAAGTMDCTIRTNVKLGNGEEFHGESLFQLRNNSAANPLPLVYPGADGFDASHDCSVLCGAEMTGKVVLCESRGLSGRIEAGQTMAAYDGVGMIVMNKAVEGYTTFTDAHVLPASHVSYEAGAKIMAYLNSTANGTASIDFKGMIIGSYLSPTVTFFSSRGPSKASPGILKPDIMGPGMNILAVWVPSDSHTEFSNDGADLSFFVESRTSMSMPHLSDIAALLKSLHPDWSPAAIKSAIRRELLLRTHVSYTHAWEGREKLARVTSALLASCMNDAMAELVELVGSSGWTEGSRAKTTGREGRARGCS